VREIIIKSKRMIFFIYKPPHSENKNLMKPQITQIHTDNKKRGWEFSPHPLISG